MSFLTPLYILGLAAISLPILFHLIRRTPKGIQPFSSLMFVVPTPPRLTRRSRLDQILLLLLRGAVIGLLAFAFARPFLRHFAAADPGNISHRLYAVLIDTSGSMQRQGIWQQVEAELEKVLGDLGPHDAVALYSFAARPQRVAGFEQAESLTPSSRRDVIRKRFQQLRPTWEESALGDALILAADDLDAVTTSGDQPTVRQLIVISDLQQGSHIESLQGYQWPQSVNVIFRRVDAAPAGDASLHVLESLAESDDPRGVRVRVTNSEDAAQSSFEVSWADASGTLLGRPVGISVPPGESRVVHISRLPPDAIPSHLQLIGDAHDFDDRFYVAASVPRTRQIVYCGQEAGDDPEQMLYYLQRAVTNDQRQPADIITDTQAVMTSLRTQRPALVVVTAQPEPDVQVAIREYLRDGGTGLLVLTRPDDAQVAASLSELPLGDAEDMVPDDYALWSEIDLEHRLFHPFANPAFSDFSKIHFWKYRRLSLPAESPWTSVVRYDNGDAALLEAQVGDGVLYVLTASWRPEESQLARSSKFVPLLLGIMGMEGPLLGLGFEVNEDVPWQRPRGETEARMIKPDGTVVPMATDQVEFSDTDQPGLYQLRSGDVEQCVAVNLARAETRTTPLDVAQLEQRGVRLKDGSTYAAEVKAIQQLRDIQLEEQQSVWQWLIAAALLLLICETLLASRWSMQPAIATTQNE